jgi:integrase
MVHTSQHQQAQEQEQYAPDSPMSDFLDVRLAKITRKQYISRLKMFFESLGLQGSLDRQSREFLVQAKKNREWAQNGLKYFIRAKKKNAEEGKLSESTIRNFYKPVRLFCSVHDIELSWKKITNTIPTGRKFANDRAPTHEEVQRVIEYPDRRIKPLVLTMCSSGIRLGAWEYLKWKHIEPIRRMDGDGKKGKIVAAKIIVYAGENEQYFSFITPEAFEALQEWMEYRRISGEDINVESWLMRTVWDTTNPRNSTVKSPKKMSREAIIQLVKRALKSEGLRTNLDMKITRRYEFKANHGFRKFFQTNAEPKMKSLDVMTLMGQDTGLAASYNKPTVEMLLEEYLKAVDNLTIDKGRLSRTAVEKVSQNQQALASQMESKDKELQELRDKMAKMEESQLKITELLEVMKIAKFSDGKVGKDRTMLDEKRRVTIGYVDDNNQNAEVKFPIDGFEIEEAGVDVVTSHLPKRRAQK